MSYLLDKKIKRKKFLYALTFVFVLFILFVFRLAIWNSLALVSHTIFRPVLVVGNNFGEKLAGFGSYFLSKKTLFLENENLKSQILASEADMANYASVVGENINLKEILGRKNDKIPMVLSAILSKPNQSPYDTLIIDIGENKNIKVGDTVFAFGDVPIGRVEIVYQNSSKVILFSNSGEKTQVIVSGKIISTISSLSETLIHNKSGDIFAEVVGRGGGNFEMILPRDFTLTKGDEVVLPGIIPHVLAIAETIISDPRDPFIKALLVSPVNIQELKFVEVVSQK